MNGNSKESSAWGGAKAAVWGLCILALVFGFALAGCDTNGDDPGSGGSGGGGGDGVDSGVDDGDGGWTAEYAVGDTGPGGGKIFYVSEAGFTVYTSEDDTTGTLCHYLEAAPVNTNTSCWALSANANLYINGTGTAIGTGRKNTALILATDDTAPAAKACKNATYGGKTDWFLPSKDELRKLYDNSTSVGGFSTSKYWSSSQASSSTAYAQFFDSPANGSYSKAAYNSVRAVRAF